jgi:hypothetical protein
MPPAPNQSIESYELLGDLQFRDQYGRHSYFSTTGSKIDNAFYKYANSSSTEIFTQSVDVNNSKYSLTFNSSNTVLGVNVSSTTITTLSNISLGASIIDLSSTKIDAHGAYIDTINYMRGDDTSFVNVQKYDFSTDAQITTSLGSTTILLQTLSTTFTNALDLSQNDIKNCSYLINGSGSNESKIALSENGQLEFKIGGVDQYVITPSANYFTNPVFLGSDLNLSGKSILNAPSIINDSVTLSLSSGQFLVSASSTVLNQPVALGGALNMSAYAIQNASTVTGSGVTLTLSGGQFLVSASSTVLNQPVALGGALNMSAYAIQNVSTVTGSGVTLTLSGGELLVSASSTVLNQPVALGGALNLSAYPINNVSTINGSGVSFTLSGGELLVSASSTVLNQPVALGGALNMSAYAIDNVSTVTGSGASLTFNNGQLLVSASQTFLNQPLLMGGTLNMSGYSILNAPVSTNDDIVVEMSGNYVSYIIGGNTIFQIKPEGISLSGTFESSGAITINGDLDMNQYKVVNCTGIGHGNDSKIVFDTSGGNVDLFADNMFSLYDGTATKLFEVNASSTIISGDLIVKGDTIFQVETRHDVSIVDAVFRLASDFSGSIGSLSGVGMIVGASGLAMNPHILYDGTYFDVNKPFKVYDETDASGYAYLDKNSLTFHDENISSSLYFKNKDSVVNFGDEWQITTVTNASGKVNLVFQNYDGAAWNTKFTFTT